MHGRIIKLIKPLLYLQLPDDDFYHCTMHLEHSLSITPTNAFVRVILSTWWWAFKARNVWRILCEIKLYQVCIWLVLYCNYCLNARYKQHKILWSIMTTEVNVCICPVSNTQLSVSPSQPFSPLDITIQYSVVVLHWPIQFKSYAHCVFNI